MNATHNQLVTIARTTGIWYLLLAVTGIIGFLVVHPQVYTSDPQQTLANLAEEATRARIRLLLEFGIIISQAFAAIWFYRLFRNIDEWAALSLLIWGTVNAVLISISAMAMASAIDLASSQAGAGDPAGAIRMLSRLISNAWGVGSIFFGLWLLPMGYIVTRSRCMPVWLGRMLLIGGLGYLANTGIRYAGISEPWVEVLTIPATIGEFWMIGYLLVFGIRVPK